MNSSQKSINGQKIHEDVFSIFIHKENSIETTLRLFHLSLLSMAIVKKTKSNDGEHIGGKEPLSTGSGNVN
jgi:hypothetical protein